MKRFADRHGKGAKSLSPEALRRLEAHGWRGNVRELQHVAEMLVLFSEGEVIDEADLPRALRPGPAAAAAPLAAKGFAAAVEAFERALLSDAIAAAGGVKAEAARKLGLDANQIKYLCRKFGL